MVAQRTRYPYLVEGPDGPRIERVGRALILRLGRGNPLWGASRIRAELHFFGHDLALEPPERLARRDPLRKQVALTLPSPFCYDASS